MSDVHLVEKIAELVAHRKHVVETVGDKVTKDWPLRTYFDGLTATLDCYLIIASLRGIDVKQWLT
jgi:hypothetical protein